MLRQKITRKLTLILFALLVVLIGSAITMQFLFVSRFHTTTDYTSRRMETIQERTPLLHQRGLSGFHKKDREKIDRLLTAFGKENSASCLLLDNNGVVLGQFNFEIQLSGQFVSYAQKLLRSGKIYDDAEKPFRIQNGLHFPTRYVGLWDTMFLHDWETDGVAYLIVISKEVHTVRDYWVFARFSLLAMGATVLVSCVAAICVARLLTEPVLRMERTARRMSNLDFSEKCSYHGKDELGDLAGSLNFLSEKLEETIGKLQEANHQLEADLTAQKELEQMRQSFVASASHEFKTPLTLLRGYLEMLREQVLPPEAQAEAEETMIAEIDRMDNLVLDMLSLSRLEVGGDEEPETPFDVKEVLNEAGRTFADVLKSRGITLKQTAPEEACVAVGNTEQISTVLTNFLSNAMNHTPKGGIIELRLEATPKQFRISVFNQGDPIAQDAIKQIWEPFFRADRTRAKNEKGTGLGLSICREILKKHGSEYGVENTRDGVLFYFTLHCVPSCNAITKGE